MRRVPLPICSGVAEAQNNLDDISPAGSLAAEWVVEQRIVLTTPADATHERRHS
jgi:hypothetical protein